MNSTLKMARILVSLAPVLAVWTFLGVVGGAMAQDQALTEEELAARYAEQSLRVSLWLDKDADQVYQRGEPLKVTFQTNEDAYAVIYHIDPEGYVSVLWPTTRYSDGFVFGGHQYRLPSRDGNRLRVGDLEGLGYVHALVSRYPFDLRDLELNFHHENGGHDFAYYVAGDPFLAMNEVNYAVTGLEDPDAYAVSNYVSYYVHRQVDHPRYLCFQCHDEGYDPYAQSCTVNIHYDYGWVNEWWGTYQYYPVYYYPVYYYVDPWCGSRWVNYWYRPWYCWPRPVPYHWPHGCYDWHDSPYWHGDSHTAYREGRERYTPLDRNTLGRDRDGAIVRTKNELVIGDLPGDDRIRAMRTKSVLARDGAAGVAADRDRRLLPGGDASNVSPTSRSQRSYEPASRIRTSPGLRIPGHAVGGDTGKQPVERTGRTRVRDDGRSPTRSQSDAGRTTIRPVEPRGDGGRVWTSRRSNTNTGSRRTPQTGPANRNSGSSRPAVQPRKQTSNRSSEVRSGSAGSSRGRSSGSQNRNSGSSVSRQPSKQTPTKASPPPSQPRSKSSSGSKGGSKGGRSSGGRR